MSEEKNDEIQSDNLKLLLANGVGSKFFVRSMVLDEGLGIIPTARLELCSSCSDNVLTMEELEAHLDKPATIKFSHVQSDADGKPLQVVSTRWMSGLVTSVEHLGVIYMQTDTKPICGYRMTIRPSLAKLCMRRSRLQFVNKTAVEVLKVLLDSCCAAKEYVLPKASGAGSGPKEAWQQVRDFSQGDETDYEFFVRVLASCGLSYHFCMKRPNEGSTGPGVAMLRIVNALPGVDTLSEIGLPTSLSLTTDSSAPAEPLLDVALSYKDIDVKNPDVIGRMTAWEMSSSLVTEKCAVSFGDGAGARLAGDDPKDGGNIIRLNHVPFDNLRSSEEVKGEIGAFLKSVRRNSRIWLGVTSRLEARVGATLKLYGFYGKADEASCIKDKTIVRTRVRLESRIPPGLLAPQGSDGWRQYVSVACISTSAAHGETDFSALPTGRLGEGEIFGGDRGTGDFAHVERTVPDSRDENGRPNVDVHVDEDWRAAAGASDAWQPTTQLLQATVCTADGKADSTNDAAAFRERDGGACYEFYAIPDGTAGDNKTMVVRYVQPVGGLGQGLFRVPRIGDRILVIRYSPTGASVGGINYLMGYLPGKDMAFTTESELKRTTGTALDKEMMALRFQAAGSKPGTDALDNAMEIRRGKEANACSEIGFYNTHVAKVRDEYGIETNVELGAGIDRERVVRERYPKKSYVELPAADQKAVDAEVKRRTAIASALGSKRNVLANFQSAGDMQLSANQDMDVNARNIHISCPKWEAWTAEKDPVTGKLVDKTLDGKVVFDDFNELVVRANRRIVLTVGGSSIVLDKDGIAIEACRWPKTRNITAITSYAVLSSFGGVKIGGPSVAVTGMFKASIGDSVGGSFTADSGTVSVAGGIIRNQTLPADITYVTVFASAVGNIVSAATGAFSKIDAVTGQWSVTDYRDPLPVGLAFENLLGLIGLGGSAAAVAGGKSADAVGLLVVSVLNLINTIIRDVLLGIKNRVGPRRWETENTADILQLLAMSVRLVAWLTAIVTLFKHHLTTKVGLTKWDALFGLPWFLKSIYKTQIKGESETTTVTLRAEDLTVESGHLHSFTVKREGWNGPLAGVKLNTAISREEIFQEEARKSIPELENDGWLIPELPG